MILYNTRDSSKIPQISFLNPHLSHHRSPLQYTLTKKYSPFKYKTWDTIDTEPLKEYTNVHVIKYGDLMNGRDTGTAFDDHKKEIHTYFENNTRILDEFEMQCL